MNSLIRETIGLIRRLNRTTKVNLILKKKFVISADRFQLQQVILI